MSEIEDLARRIRELCEVEKLADKPRCDVLQQRMLDDAAWQRTALENVMCTKVPETIGDVLSLMKVVSYRIQSELVGHNETAVRFTIDNVLQGLIKLAGPDCSPITHQYGGIHPPWVERVEAFKRRELPARS